MNSNKPTRKIQGATLAGAIVTVLVWGISLTGVEVPGIVGAAMATICSSGLGYLVKDD